MINPKGLVGTFPSVNRGRNISLFKLFGKILTPKVGKSNGSGVIAPVTSTDNCRPVVALYISRVNDFAYVPPVYKHLLLTLHA